jgi:hypothetical protein
MIPQCKNKRKRATPAYELYDHSTTLQSVVSRQIGFTADRQCMSLASRQVSVTRESSTEPRLNPQPLTPTESESAQSLMRLDDYGDVPQGFSEGCEGLEGMDIVALPAPHYENSVRSLPCYT